MPNENNISWEAPEFKDYQKNPAWYATLIIIAGLIVAYEIFQQDWFGAVSIAIIAGFIFGFARQKPNIIPIVIDSKGISVNNVEVPYTTMKHFWIVEDANHRTLNIETNAYINRTVIVELENQDRELIREILKTKVSEHESAEPTFAQKIMHRIGF